MTNSSDSPCNQPCGEGDSTAVRHSDLCAELSILSGEVAHRAGEDIALVGACAVHAGLQMMLRELSSKAVIEWLDSTMSELRTTGGLSEVRSPSGSSR
jgi:hypothetical protein